MSIWTTERQQVARATAGKWLGTPHKNRMAKPGVGIDCLGFLREVAVDTGVLPPFDLPFYNPSWGIGREFNVIERVLLDCCHSQRVKAHEEIEFGDVVVWTVGRQSNHVGIVLDGAVWHVQARRHCQPDPINEAMMERLQAVVRLTGEGFLRRPETLTVEDLKP